MPLNKALEIHFAPYVLVVLLTCRGQQELRALWGRQDQWDPRDTQGGLAQRVFEASQVPRSVHNFMLRQHHERNICLC